MANFDTIICHHVYRERNGAADKLSKEGLELEQGVWKILETTDREHYEYYHRPFLDIRHA